MVYRYDCNGFFNQIRLGSYQLALPVPEILKLCNYLQNVGAKTYIFGLQLSTFLFYNKQSLAIWILSRSIVSSVLMFGFPELFTEFPIGLGNFSLLFVRNLQVHQVPGIFRCFFF